MAWYAEQTIEI